MGIVKAINLAVRFVLELCVLVVVGYWGFHTGRGAIAKIGLGIGAPLVIAVVWGLLLAPRAARRLHEPWRVSLEIVVFGAAAAALAAAGRPLLAWILALAFAINRILIVVWGQ